MQESSCDNSLFGSSTNVGIVRNENQDSKFVGKNQYGQILAIVCDGLGGYKGGKIASDIVCNCFSESFSETNFEEWNEEAIENWFEKNLNDSKEKITKKIIELSKDENNNIDGENIFENMATTIVCCVVCGDKIYTFWVGDSRAYMIDDDKTTWQITKDHNLYNYLMDLNASDETMYKYRHELLALTNIVGKIGGKNQRKHGVSINNIEKEKYLLLCSDGFYNFIKPEEFHDLICEYYDETGDLDITSKKLLDIAMERKSNDNLTVAIVNLEKLIK